MNRYQLLNRDEPSGDSMKRVASTSAMGRPMMAPPTVIPSRRSDSRDKPRGGGAQARGAHMAPRPSKERERASALAVARQLSGGAAPPSSGRGSAPPSLQVRGPGSRTHSRESSRNRESGASTPSGAEAAPAQELPRDKLERKTGAIVDEFLDIKDVKVCFLGNISLCFLL